MQRTKVAELQEASAPRSRLAPMRGLWRWDDCRRLRRTAAETGIAGLLEALTVAYILPFLEVSATRGGVAERDNLRWADETFGFDSHRPFVRASPSGAEEV